MMAAMMLPGAVPALSRFVRTGGRAVVAALFAGSYLAVWTLVGFAVYVAYRPHGSFAAGVLTITAGCYELTPLKRTCRRRCRERVQSGFEFGVHCLGSSAGLMLLLVALGVMSIGLMAVVALVVLVVLVHKVLPPSLWLDVPVALAIVALGIVILISPASVPGIIPTT